MLTQPMFGMQPLTSSGVNCPVCRRRTAGCTTRDVNTPDSRRSAATMVRMDTESHRALQTLRSAGYAVVLIYPAELSGIDVRQLEAQLTDMGNEYVRSLRG